MQSRRLAFCLRFVEAQESVRVQAFGPKFSVERLDEGVVSGLEELAFHVSLQIELLADELRAIVDADRLGIAKLGSTIFEGLDNMGLAIVFPDTDRRRQATLRR